MEDSLPEWAQACFGVGIGVLPIIVAFVVCETAHLEPGALTILGSFIPSIVLIGIAYRTDIRKD